MNFLNGWKTLLGAIGTITTLAIASGGKVGEIAATVQQVAGHADGIATGVFGTLLTLGVIHKREKAKAKEGR